MTSGTPILYHNPRCSKSRRALELLRERGIEPEVRRYLETPPSVEEIRDLLARSGLSARELLRRGERISRELGLGEPSRTDEELVAAMAEHPILIERPILVRGPRAVVGRPPERVVDLVEE